MAKAFLIHAFTGGRNQNFNVTDFYSIGGRLTGITVEASAQIRKRAAGVLSAMSVYIKSNTLNANTTCRSRVNTANGTQLITIGAGATGYFRDLVNTDAIASGDLVNWTIVTTASGSGALLPMAITGIFDATVNTNKVMASTSTAGTNYSSSAVSAFVPIGGDAGQTATEVNAQCQFQGSGTLSNLFVRVLSNARATTTNVFVRLNGADTAITVAIGALATGFFEDTVNTQAVVAGDLLNYRIIGGAEVTAITFPTFSTGHTTTDGTFQMASSVLNGANWGGNATRYIPMGGGIALTSTESDTQLETNMMFAASKLTANVTTNTCNTNGTLNLRKNLNIDTGVALTIPATTTGFFNSNNSMSDVNLQEILTLKGVSGGNGAQNMVIQTTTMLGSVQSVVADQKQLRVMGVGQ